MRNVGNYCCIFRIIWVWQVILPDDTTSIFRVLRVDLCTVISPHFYASGTDSGRPAIVFWCLGFSAFSSASRSFFVGISEECFTQFRNISGSGVHQLPAVAYDVYCSCCLFASLHSLVQRPFSLPPSEPLSDGLFKSAIIDREIAILLKEFFFTTFSYHETYRRYCSKFLAIWFYSKSKHFLN